MNQSSLYFFYKIIFFVLFWLCVKCLKGFVKVQAYYYYFYYSVLYKVKTYNRNSQKADAYFWYVKKKRSKQPNITGI